MAPSRILKNFPEVMDQLARDKKIDPAAIEVWFADEARVGQKNQDHSAMGQAGSRPSAPHDQRTASTYIFGAICPNSGKGAALVVLPRLQHGGDEIPSEMRAPEEKCEGATGSLATIASGRGPSHPRSTA
jgi:hypothetical protein